MFAVNTIQDAQTEIEKALDSLPNYLPELPDALKSLLKLAPPKGLHAKVSLRHGGKKERQVKRNAPVSSWSPEEGVISISYDTLPEDEVAQVPLETPSKVAERIPILEAHRQSVSTKSVSPQNDPVREIVQALAKAETGNQFVALKWFRDTYLPQEGLVWAATPEERHRVLADAINRRCILTSRIPNPRNPQYPVTAIRINRPLAEVRGILDHDAGERPRFAPITIPGESLSATVLRERR